MEEDASSRWTKFKNGILDNLLTIILVFAIVSGVVVGLVIRPITKDGISERESKYIEMPGNILIRMLKWVAIPLIVSCIIVALGSLELSISKTVSWQILLITIIMKLISAAFGLVFVLIVRPGKFGKMDQKQSSDDEGSILDIFLDMVLNIFPSNLFQMNVEQYKTTLTPPKNNETSHDIMTWTVQRRYIGGLNMLGMVLISSIFGLSISILKNRGQEFLHISRDVYNVTMKVITWILWISPLLIFFLILKEILSIKDINDFFSTWGILILTVLATFTFMILLEFPIILFILARENAFKLYVRVAKALATAFVTASSMGTIPILVQSLIETGMDKRLVQFVVPVSVSINKDGAAAYLTICTIFIADLTMKPLSAGHYFSVLILGAFGSIATPGVPFSAIIVLVMILTGLGLPQGMGLNLLAVEWINDRMCTFVNIAGTCILTMLIEKWNKDLFADYEE